MSACEVELEVTGVPTQRSLIDALEAGYPVLLRNDPRPCHAEAARRSCASSLARRTSPTSPRTRPLPDAVLNGAEPFFVIGAMAGG